MDQLNMQEIETEVKKFEDWIKTQPELPQNIGVISNQLHCVFLLKEK
jgi:hypothetical protein